MRKQKHPFPKLNIVAHSGSSVVIGCSGPTTIGGPMLADEMEEDLLRAFRSLPLKERVKVMRDVYELEERRRSPQEEVLRRSHIET